MKKLLTLLLVPLLPVFAAESRFENLSQYFDYLPDAVYKNWIPYKANSDYEVIVQFRVWKNGAISELIVVKSTNKNAEASVINAVKAGAPYEPLPANFPENSVKTQVEIQYIKPSVQTRS